MSTLKMDAPFTERAEALLDIGIDNLMAAVHTHSNFETENNAGTSECQKNIDRDKLPPTFSSLQGLNNWS